MTAEIQLNLFSFISLAVLIIVYFFLIIEKLNKVIVAVLGGVALIFAQVFKTATSSSQENAFEFINHNLDVLGFVIGMMVLVGIVRESGLFEAVSIKLVQLTKGSPTGLLVMLSLLTLLMTTFLSNIPTVLIMAPVIFVLMKQLKLPVMPYLMSMVTMANLGGAMTPISDPTTYYQAKVVGLSFTEVITNSGVIVVLLSVVSIAYYRVVFFKDFAVVKKTSIRDLSSFRPELAIQNKKILLIGTPLLVLAILLMISKDYIRTQTGITLDNATVTLGAAFLALLVFHREPKNIFKNLVDWEIIFFFMGLFVVVGALEFTHVIELLARLLVDISNGSSTILLLLITMGSGLLSTFIDNVPYNITMVGAIQAMKESGIEVYPLWWALNLGTSIGGAGSPIAAACNVIVFGQAEREGLHVSFVKYLLRALPLVVINTLIAFAILYLRYL